jgi:cytochrome P450
MLTVGAVWGLWPEIKWIPLGPWHVGDRRAVRAEVTLATENLETSAESVRRNGRRYHFDRHTPEYRGRFEAITEELQSTCPVAWSDTYGGHWVISAHQEVFDLARQPDLLSSEKDLTGERPAYQGISIPDGGRKFGMGFLEMDPPAQRHYRQALNPYLSPAAVARWTPFVDEIVRASLNEKIESGTIDFVDDLANIVPAVLTLAMMGLPLADWPLYSEPTHAIVYTPPESPDRERVLRDALEMNTRLLQAIVEIRERPRPGLINALITAKIDGRTPADSEITGALALLIGGGFDTTTALTAHALEYLSENPGDRARLSAERESLLDSATEEFLRFYTPAPGDARTITRDCNFADTSFKEGERLWLSWAMANRDPAVFPSPNTIQLDRKGNRHTTFGLGIHRCIGSNMARMTFKRMLLSVLDRMPDYRCDPAAAVHYPTVGVIQGMQHLPATFTPGRPLGAGLEETLASLQKACDDRGLAEPVTGQR